MKWTTHAMALFGLATLLLAGCSVYRSTDDRDGDGYQRDVDCDDTRADVHPSAEEICEDGIDQDCNGEDAVCTCIDADFDGWCVDEGDCDDADASVNPDQDELYNNGKDDDCDPATRDEHHPCDDADCHDAGLPGQGRDRDGDLWGECCDCDDADPHVYPLRTEIIYNGKDDDCDPATSDGDIDGDGYDSMIVGGPDCDDRNASVHPGAEERCDNVDTDCDGVIDPPGCYPDDCPDVAGTYDVMSDCRAFPSMEDVPLEQDRCTLFLSDPYWCNGFIDEDGSVSVECGGVAVGCPGQLRPDGSIDLECDLRCSMVLNPFGNPDPAACQRNADCPEGRSCQLFVAPDGLELEPTCYYGAGPLVDNTGHPCGNDTDCFSVWCDVNRNFCQGVCTSGTDCPAYEDSPQACAVDADCSLDELCDAGRCLRPFECSTSAFFLGTDVQDDPIWDLVDLCRPVRRACALDADCRAGEACQVRPDQDAAGAETICAPGLGYGQVGADCYQGGTGACWSGLCLVDDGGPGGLYCSATCVVAEDCGDPLAWDCQAVPIDVRPGYSTHIPMCVRL